MSFLDKLKGKISNTFDKYIDDPDLKKYADKLLKKDSFTTDADADADATTPLLSKAIKTTKADADATDADATDADATEDTSSSIDLVQLFGAQNAPSYVKSILRVIQYLIIPLPIAILVANEMMMYSPAIRVIFFIFTFVICIKSLAIASGFYIYYLIRAIYCYYNNKYTENPPMNWNPYIFAMLPIKVSAKDDFYNGLFLSYGGSEEEIKELKKIMEKYSNDLNESFPYLKKVEKTPEFANQYLEATKYTIELHAPPAKTKEEMEQERKETMDKQKIEELKKTLSSNQNLPPTIKESAIRNRIELLSKKESDRTENEKKILAQYNAENAKSNTTNVKAPNATKATNATNATKATNVSLPPTIAPNATKAPNVSLPPTIAPNVPIASPTNVKAPSASTTEEKEPTSVGSPLPGYQNPV